MSAHRPLQIALAVFGAIFLLIYPLAIVWPSGWAWHAGAPYESQYFLMIIDERTYCVYIAPNEQVVREHTRQGRLPANRVSRARTVIEPTTAED